MMFFGILIAMNHYNAMNLVEYGDLDLLEYDALYNYFPFLFNSNSSRVIPTIQNLVAKISESSTPE